MTPREFEQGLDRWGADLDQWPSRDAEEAREYLATSREARRLLDAGLQVEGFLSALAEHSAPPWLAGRIAVEVAARARPDALEQLLGWFGAHLWRPAVCALLITTAGFLVGTAVSGPDLDEELAEDVMTLAFSDIYAEVDDAQP